MAYGLKASSWDLFQSLSFISCTITFELKYFVCVIPMISKPSACMASNMMISDGSLRLHLLYVYIFVAGATVLHGNLYTFECKHKGKVRMCNEARMFRIRCMSFLDAGTWRCTHYARLIWKGLENETKAFYYSFILEEVRKSITDNRLVWHL